MAAENDTDKQITNALLFDIALNLRNLLKTKQYERPLKEEELNNTASELKEYLMSAFGIKIQ